MEHPEGHALVGEGEGQRGPGIRNAEPQEIANALAGLIIHPKPRVRVTKLARAAAQAQRSMPLAAYMPCSPRESARRCPAGRCPAGRRNYVLDTIRR